VDKLGNTGPWTGWTQGTSSDDASEVLDYLKGKITETELGQELLGPVEDAGKLKDMWSVKVGQTVDGKLYTAGIGVGVENTPEGMQSLVLILADRFAVLNTADGQDSAVSVPFAIENNQVFMNSAFIKEASIDSAKIAQQIQSSNYIDGQRGWAINKNGYAQFQQVTVRGSVYSDAGYFNNGTIGNCHILEDCVIDGKLSAANIEGNLVQGNSFSFTISNTNGQRIIRYESNPLMPMRIYGYVMAVMSRQQKTKIYFNGEEGTAVDGLSIARNGDSASSYAYTTMFSFSRDVGKGEGLDINVHAGALDQGAGQSTKYTVMIWATPQNSGFSAIYP
jgi:predicted phage tail protein